MNKIGILYGMEDSFPPALVDRINALITERSIPNLQAESLLTGGVEMAVPCGYRLIIDRISHDIPFYRSYLKNAVLTGTTVINNPFWWSADDKFFNYALASKLGIAIPPTILLPHKQFPTGTTAKSMRNLQYPLDWEAVFAYVGFPAFLKPHDGGGWRDVYRVDNPGDFFGAYDQSRDLCMTLQRGVNFGDYFRCYCINREKVHIMRYDPRQPHHLRYVPGNAPPDAAMEKRLTEDCLTICKALGYDLNTVEFAVEDGIPYAIDFMNPAPDAGLESVGPDNFRWIIDAVAEMAVAKALAPPAPPPLTWAAFLSESKVQ